MKSGVWDNLGSGESEVVYEERRDPERGGVWERRDPKGGGISLSKNSRMPKDLKRCNESI